MVTSANEHDKHPLPDLLHGKERRVYGDSAYASQKALIHSKAPQAKDFTNQRVKRNGEVDASPVILLASGGSALIPVRGLNAGLDVLDRSDASHVSVSCGGRATPMGRWWGCNMGG